MALHLFVFVLLLVVCLLFLLVLLWRLVWFPLRPPASPQGGANRRRLPRSLCRAAQTIAWPVDSPPLPRRLESRHLCLCVPGVR